MPAVLALGVRFSLIAARGRFWRVRPCLLLVDDGEDDTAEGALRIAGGNGFARLAGLGVRFPMAVAFLPTLGSYRISRWKAPSLPVIAAFCAWFALDSTLQHRRGRGAAWKRRLQAQAERPMRP